jgi:hypothetical protein
MNHAKRCLKPSSQCERILAWLARGRTLTTLQAFKRMQITTLSQRCGELRDRGHDVKSEMVTLRSGKRVARYSLR